MNFNIPNEKEIRKVFNEGEEMLVALFGGVTAQVEEPAGQLEKQAGVLKDSQTRLSKNSRNSGKPPSSDRYGKGNRTNSKNIFEAIRDAFLGNPFLLPGYRV